MNKKEREEAERIRLNELDYKLEQLKLEPIKKAIAKETRKQIAKEIFADVEAVGFKKILGKILITEPAWNELKKKYLGDVTFLNKKAQSKKVKKRKRGVCKNCGDNWGSHEDGECFGKVKLNA